MSESDKTEEPEKTGKREKKPKPVDHAAALLEQWRLLTEASAQPELSLDDVRRFIAKVHVAIKGKFKLTDLPIELKNMLSSRDSSENHQGEDAVRVAEKPPANEPKSSHHGLEDPPAAPTVAPPAPQAPVAKQALSAELKKALDAVVDRVESASEKTKASVQGLESRVMDAVARLEGNLAALKNNVAPGRLAEEVRGELGQIDERLRRLEKAIGDTIVRLESSFSMADAKQVVALRVELEREVGPHIREQISDQFKPILQIFDHLAAENELTPEKMRGVMNALRERAIRVGLTVE